MKLAHTLGGAGVRRVVSSCGAPVCSSCFTIGEGAQKSCGSGKE